MGDRAIGRLGDWGGAGDTTVKERQDMRVLQVGRGLDLGEEPLGADHGGEFRPQHLDRYFALVPDVVCEVDGGHAALAELPLDGVAVGERGGQAVNGVCQRCLG